MARMTGAQALVGSLVREGVEVVFGLPGVQIMDAFDALYDEPRIRLVTVRHEQATTYMAGGYARTTGKVGVGLVVPGPGALNAAAGLATAYSTSSPVLLISGQMESYNLGKRRGALHEIEDQLDVLRPITKWCDRVMNVEEIPSAVHQAMKHLLTGRPRPVELEIPWDVLPQSAEVELPEAEVFPKQDADPGEVRRAAELLSSARRPLIWAGGGTVSAHASGALVELATSLNAPVITTPEAKGIIPESHPLSLGAFYYGYGTSVRAMPQADVILAVGSRLHVSPSLPWVFHKEQKLVQIDADPEELGRNRPTNVAIAADARLGLQALLSELGGTTSDSEWTREEVSAIREETYAEIREMAPLEAEIIVRLRGELEDDAIVVSGITEIGYWSHLAFPVLMPGSYLTSSYFATLGYAFRHRHRRQDRQPWQTSSSAMRRRRLHVRDPGPCHGGPGRGQRRGPGVQQRRLRCFPGRPAKTVRRQGLRHQAAQSRLRPARGELRRTWAETHGPGGTGGRPQERAVERRPGGDRSASPCP